MYDPGQSTLGHQQRSACRLAAIEPCPQLLPPVFFADRQSCVHPGRNAPGSNGRPMSYYSSGNDPRSPFGGPQPADRLRGKVHFGYPRGIAFTLHHRRLYRAFLAEHPLQLDFGRRSRPERCGHVLICHAHRHRHRPHSRKTGLHLH